MAVSMTFAFTTTLVSSLVVGITLGDNSAEEWQNPYQHWNPDGNVAPVYKGQYSYDTSPNPRHALALPGVAASVFFSTAGVSK